jgi:hypothetical protein
MRALVPASLLWILSGCFQGDSSASDDSAAGNASDPPCTAAFTVTYPDGSGSTFDGCATWGLDAGFEFDPDAPPALTTATLRFDAWDDPSFTCGVQLQLGDVCEAGTYPVSGTTTVRWSTADCSGTTDANEGDYDGTLGYVDVQTVDNGTQPGNLDGQALATRLRGAVRATSADGTVLDGTFDLAVTQPATAVDATGTCEAMDGDADGDGEVTDAVGGVDCDDTDPDVRGTDGDGDGLAACDGDCDDTDATVHPGAGCAYTRVEAGPTCASPEFCNQAWSITEPSDAMCPTCTVNLTTGFVYVSFDAANGTAQVWITADGFVLVEAPAATLTRGSPYDTLEFTLRGSHIEFRLHYR